MPTYVVYLDEVFLENLAMDFLLLHTAARLCRIEARPWRTGLAAVLGGLYALTLFFSAGRPLTGAGGKVLVSLVMVAVAYAPLSFKRFFLALASFYLVAVTAVGAALAAAYMLAGPGNRLWDADLVLAGRLMPAVAGALPPLWFVGRLVRRRLESMVLDVCRLRLSIGLQGRRVQVDALVDTGNRLEDPLTGHPVVVVEADALKPLLPEGLTGVLAAPGEVDLEGLAALAGSDLASRLRLIPFQTLGRGGLMVGFRPDRLEIVLPAQCKSINGVVVGITGERFDSGLNCRALVHPRLMEQILA
ncbi:MAG: sigma-E processing peptidase SpoIIGA [Peptococcaceae bacterium]|jgi:stage II sporulation protein GA (sporulation sigma-E factor processing peptidase)|nr:sigma-E processing peptidase SpoIIGA [Peptococcaceae bacterium]